MSNELSITYEGSMRAVAKIPNGESKVVMGACSCFGETDTDFTPLDLLGASYAGCVIMSIDIVAKKNGLDIAGAEVKVSLDTNSSGGPVIGGINVTIVLPKQFTDEQLDLLRKGEAYCPVHNALRPEIKTTLTFECHDEGIGV